MHKLCIRHKIHFSRMEITRAKEVEQADTRMTTKEIRKKERENEE